ncbi:MAG TPA: PD-(D/E)XK nuclease family protein [Flavobacteriaceae bacterium]|nr:PD-(D/E)XK nuclease family protein [Flavobacteriaceae bacterium]
MKSFIAEVIEHLVSVDTNFENTIFVLPSKRSGRFLLRKLNERLDKSIFSPEIFSIEEFVEEISGLSTVDTLSSLFSFYETYQKLTPVSDQEEFDVFYGWAQVLLHDFNETDRYLIDAQVLFSYLSNIQDLKHWSQQEEKTELVKNYLNFWKKLPEYYTAFTHKLIAENKAYQGLQYRIASEKTIKYLNGHSKKIIFAGLNALNKAEEKIVETILDADRGEIFWDIDKVFFDDAQHGASFFIRNNKATWSYYQENKNPFNWIKENYQFPKNIEITGVPKNVGQAKHVGSILSKLSEAELEKTAVVLADEGLAPVILNSLPNNISDLNLTLGLPLEKTPLASLFELLFKIHVSSPTVFYHKEVFEILNHPAIVSISKKSTTKILQTIKKENFSFLSKEKIIDISDPENKEIIELCFSNYKNQPSKFLGKLCRLTETLKQPGAPLQNEYLFHFHILFKKLLNLIDAESPVKSIKTLHQIYKANIQTETLDFSGSPFSGLQIMGMLETRLLDFETLIITTVNEGVLPAGKSTHSFVPYDLKKEFGLPTYKEKDAIYTYHFYRLLQRAKNVHLIYNSVPGDLNAGEKSRFITQLKIEKQALHNIRESSVLPIVPSLKNELKSISKTPEILQKIQELAAKGFSPSALLTYVRNPLDYYNKYILGVKETEMVEETVAANTLGTVIHDSLEELYTNNENKAYLLAKNHLETALERYPAVIQKQFGEHYRAENLTTGKNLIALKIANRYVRNFLKAEQKSIMENTVEIIHLEKEMKVKLDFDELNFPVFIKGKADRIDKFNGVRRIIDYKTGKVEAPALKISDWDELVQDYNYSKAFQVLFYLYLAHRENPLSESEAGIISFKNLKGGFLKFFDNSEGSKSEIPVQESLEHFEIKLKSLILEICDPEIPFLEKEVEEFFQKA